MGREDESEVVTDHQTNPGSSSAPKGSIQAESTSDGSKSVESGAPALSLLEPGVGVRMHLAARSVLILLNCVLLASAVMGVNHPHSIVMFVLSIGLSASYFWFVNELSKADEQSVEKKTK